MYFIEEKRKQIKGESTKCFLLYFLLEYLNRIIEDNSVDLFQLKGHSAVCRSVLVESDKEIQTQSDFIQ